MSISNCLSAHNVRVNDMVREISMVESWGLGMVDHQRLGNVGAVNVSVIDGDAVKTGGTSFVDWAVGLIESSMSESVDWRCRGELVPQLGIEAGSPLRFDVGPTEFHSCVNLDSETDHTVHWETNHTGIEITKLRCEHGDSHLESAYVPLASDLDRPIGYMSLTYAATGNRKVIAAASHAAMYISFVVRAEKATLGLKQLSEPVWVEESTTQTTAQSVAENCAKALAAPATMVWTVDTDSDQLTTIAIGGILDTSTRADMPIGRGVAGRCAQVGRTIIVDDLLDDKELSGHGIANLYNPGLVEKYGLRSGIYLPMDVGGHAAGVLAVYGTRPRAFSDLDISIASAFAQRLTAGYVHVRRLEELAKVEDGLHQAAPAIEAGMLAMERVHDIDNHLIRAQSRLSQIYNRFGRNETHIIKELTADTASMIDRAHRSISGFVRRSRLGTINPSKFDLAEIAREAKERMEPQLRAHRVSCTVNAPDELRVTLDEEAVMRVLLNLIENSIYWLSVDQKSIRRQIKIAVTGDDESDVVGIEVYDNGRGIAPTALEHVFEYFYTNRPGKGLGFGLAITKRLIEQHKGSIKVESVWGENAVFTVSMPRDVNA